MQTTLVETPNGSLEGITESSGIRSFKGVPYAQPPVGPLRFASPVPVRSWKGVKKANRFGPRAMQLPLFSDMTFRSNGMSEDCLYLNVWTPAKSSKEKLPVLVYFYGGGFVGGDGSEYRYDGESLAKRGIVTVTVNYRLGVFGFLAHPELTRESATHSSGNYGLMDQHEALEWVQKNISAFGGDPARVTIGGESAGSFSVSAQMASPLSAGLFAGAIGESGSLLGDRVVSLAGAEKNGVRYADSLHKTIASLRAMPAEALLATTSHTRFPVAIDGYFLPSSPRDIYQSGKQMKVTLLAGWNSAENGYQGVLGEDSPTVANFEKALNRLYGEHAAAMIKVYAASNPEEVKQAATDLASDRFIAYSTWKWIDMHSKTGEKPVYRYLYAHPRPPVKGMPSTAVDNSMGAGHSWEIEYALGNLATNAVYAWGPDDEKVSALMENYFASFILTGDPNGNGQLLWPAVNSGEADIMVIDVKPYVKAEAHADRHALLDSLYSLKK